MRVYTGSGTGSIADQIGAESYLFEKHWVLVVTRTHPPITYKAENGYLRLDWAPFRSSELREYVISSQNYGREIGRSTTNHFIDSCYVGEGGYFSIHVILKSGVDLYWGECELSNELPKLKCSASPTNQYFVYWTKNRFYNGISKVDLYKQDASGVYNKVNSSNSVNDSIYELNNALFGESLSYKIIVVPKLFSFGTLPGYEQKTAVYSSQYAGYRFSEQINYGDAVCPVGEHEIIYPDRAKGLVRFSLQTLKPIESFAYKGNSCQSTFFSDLEVSPKGDYYISHICDYENIIIGKTSDIGNYQLNNLNNLTGQQSWKIPLSDNNIGLVTSIIWGLNGIYLYDFNKGSIIGSYTVHPTIAHGITISSTGEYMAFFDSGLQLIHYAGNQFTVLKSYPYNVNGHIKFSSADADQYAFYDQSVFAIEKCSDQSTVYSFPLNGEKLLSIDFRNKQILTAANLHLFVRSMTDGSLLRDIPVRTDELYSYNPCCLTDHKIISSNGLIYFL